MVALLNRGQRRTERCRGHHFHFQGGIPRPHWRCCACPERARHDQPQPENTGPCVDPPIDPADDVLAWLDAATPQPRKA